MDLSHDGTILADAYGLASRFNFFKAHFVLGRCNIVADKLAGLVKKKKTLAGLANVWNNQT